MAYPFLVFSLMGRPTSYKPVFPPKPPGCAARVQLIPSGEYTRSPCGPGRICLRDVPAVSVKGNIFPLHRLSRYPIRYTLFRDWGTPKSLLLSTCHSTKYPNPSSSWRMAANVLPPSWLSSPGTFSSSRYAGLFASVSRAISKNRVPLGSANPPRFPAIEKAWLFRYRNNQSYAEEIVIPKFELQPNK